MESPGIDEGMYRAVARLCFVMDRLDSLNSGTDVTEQNRPTILIFLPGILEIETMMNVLNDLPNTQHLLIPLHSSITFDEQQKVFRPSNRGVRKIVLATNIAESSITIPDVKYGLYFFFHWLHDIRAKKRT